MNSSSFEEYSSRIPKDEATMRLAHPVRVPMADPLIVEGLPKIVGPVTWQAMLEGFRRQDEMTANVVMDLSTDPRHARLIDMMRASAQMPGGSEVGHFYGNLVVLRQFVAPAPFFRIDDHLCELLLHTDLDEDIPVEVLKAPYPRFYVEFGSRRDLPLHVPNDMTGMHVAEGAYVEFGVRRDAGPGFYVVFTGSPLGKSNALDDATHSMFLRMSDGVTVKQAIEESYRLGNQYAQEYGFRTASDDTLAPARVLLNFLAKVLLYINLPEARRTLHADKTEHLKSIAGLKSTSKKNKAARRGKALVDYILVTAPPAAGGIQQPDVSEAGRSVKTHWRRGHYRMQAYGPEHSLRKLAFIRPTLVNADLGMGAREAPTYKVT